MFIYSGFDHKGTESDVDNKVFLVLKIRKVEEPKFFFVQIDL